MGPFCLVKSRSQDTAANAGVLSVYLPTILYYHHQLFIDIDRDDLSIYNLVEQFNEIAFTFNGTIAYMTSYT